MSVGALFVDFNSYFASVEQQLQPALRGRPVAVLPVMAETTCCIAASYEAKALGVKTGTRVWEARRRCPDMVFVPARHEHYIEFHHRLVDVVESCAPVAEVRSIDEMWCALPGRWSSPAVAIDIARQIKQRIREQVGDCLTSSIGIAPNWFLAKIASNMQKPDGLTVVDSSDVPERFFALQLSDIYGIGRRNEQRLRQAGIHTIEQLYAARRETLHGVYQSIQGERLYDLLRGQTLQEAETQRASISHSHVLPPHMRHPDDALAVLHRLLQKAAMRLRKMQYHCGELRLRVIGMDGMRHKPTHRFTATNDTAVLTKALLQLWQGLEWADNQPRAVGVVLSRLTESQATTLDLFDDGRRERLNATLDRLNARFGKNTIWYGGATRALDEAPMRIAFTRIPDIETER